MLPTIYLLLHIYSLLLGIVSISAISKQHSKKVCVEGMVWFGDKDNAIHVDSGRLVDLNSDTGKIVVNTEYPCAFT